MPRRTLQASGSEGWWKLREACLLAVGALSERIIDVQQGGSRGRGGSPLDVAGLMDNVLSQDLAPADVPPFLLGRALWVTARWVEGTALGAAGGRAGGAVHGRAALAACRLRSILASCACTKVSNPCTLAPGLVQAGLLASPGAAGALPGSGGGAAGARQPGSRADRGLQGGGRAMQGGGATGGAGGLAADVCRWVAGAQA